MNQRNLIITTESQLKMNYSDIVSTNPKDYCLITISIKKFPEYLHTIGQNYYHEVISAFLHQLSSVLKHGGYASQINYNYFCVMTKCEHTLDALHSTASSIHYAVRDGMEKQFGRKLYISLGFYPILPPYPNFYDAQYFANLCRKGSEYRFPETNYDMYGVSYIDRQETFLKLESSVHEAMEHGDFKLYLQPKVNVLTGEVISAEALVRWIDAERGMIPLCNFLPQMEENGYIRDLDRYLFQIACKYLERWLHKFDKKINISFNLSRAYFNGPYFMPEYTEIFKQYDIPGDCIRIEILESIVLDDTERLHALVNEIYDFGFSCALDDFGSGFSTFSILTSTRLSELKIDRTLFQDINNPNERALIKHIIDIAHDMNLICVAEGIETQDYADYLKEIACDYIQGFLYYKPMPIDEFEKRFITDNMNS